jgi:hypothetical protein
MTMDVFSFFRTTPYTFQKFAKGTARGNKVVQEYQAEGVFKLRRGLTMGQNMQNANSTATLHIRPTEPFLDDVNDLVGNGIQYNGKDYRIVGVTEGMNFHTNVLEHLMLTLQVESHV